MAMKRYDPSAALEVSYLFDDFPGLLYNSRIWSVRGTGGTATLPSAGVGGQLQLVAYPSNYYELYISLLSFTLARKFQTSWRVKLENLTERNSWWGLCGATSPAEAVAVGYNNAVGGNWLLAARTGSVETRTDTGIAADTNWHEFRIAGNTGVATCFIDEVPVGNMISGLPAGSLSPFCRSTSTAAAQTKSIILDWIEVYGDRV